MSPALVVHDLWKAYAVGVRGCSVRVSVLRGVDLQVAQGERVGILGGPACGKTTLLHCLAGLRRPDAGRIRMCAAPEHLRLLDEGRLIGAPPPRVAAATLIVGRELAMLRPCVDRVVVLRDGRITALDSDVGRRVAERGECRVAR